MIKKFKQYGKYFKISNTICLPKRPGQTEQTQIRLLLKKDPDQTASEEAVWSGSSLFAFLTSILWITALKTNQKNCLKF